MITSEKYDIVLLRQEITRQASDIPDNAFLAAAYILGDTVSMVDYDVGIGGLVESSWPKNDNTSALEAEQKEVERISEEFSKQLGAATSATEFIGALKWEKEELIKAAKIRVEIAGSSELKAVDLRALLNRPSTYFFRNPPLTNDAIEKLTGRGDGLSAATIRRAQEVSVALGILTSSIDLTGLSEEELIAIKKSVQAHIPTYRLAIRDLLAINDIGGDGAINIDETVSSTSYYRVEPELQDIRDRENTNTFSHNTLREFASSPRIVLESIGALILGELTEIQVAASAISLSGVALGHLIKSWWDKREEEAQIRASDFYLLAALDKLMSGN